MTGNNGKIKQCEGKPTHADARSIFTHTLEAVLPEPAVRRYVNLDQGTNTLMVACRKYDLNKFERIIVIGGGKAARRTGAELVKINSKAVGCVNMLNRQVGLFLWSSPMSLSLKPEL
jgi:hypothetical protein